VSLPQENFERAVSSAEDTLGTLASRLTSTPQLGRESKQRLQTWMWDLEAIAAAIRLELMNRDDRPIDLG